MALNRRQLIHRGAAGAGLVVVGNLTSCSPASAAAVRRAGKRRLGRCPRDGPVAPGRPATAASTPDPAKLLDLPEGFTYKSSPRPASRSPAPTA